MNMRPFFRKDGPKEIGLNTFYQLSKQERLEHIDALKTLPFENLSQRDFTIICFWYQKWDLTDWPENKKLNFFSIEEETQIKEVQPVTGTSIPDDDWIIYNLTQDFDKI